MKGRGLDNIGKRIREYREHAGYTQRELGSIAGINPSTLSKLENGSCRHYIENLGEITAALGVSLDEVVYGRLPVEMKRIPDDVCTLALNPKMWKCIRALGEYMQKDKPDSMDLKMLMNSL